MKLLHQKGMLNSGDIWQLRGQFNWTVGETRYAIDSEHWAFNAQHTHKHSSQHWKVRRKAKLVWALSTKLNWSMDLRGKNLNKEKNEK